MGNMGASSTNSAVLAVAWKTGGQPPPAPHSSWALKLLPALVAGGVASYQCFFRHHLVAGGILYGIAVLLLVTALFIPPLHAALTRFFQRFGRVVGVGVTWLLLVPFYFLFFATARVFLLLTGKDPLTRRWDKTAASYWVDRKPVTDDNHFKRQS